MISEENGVHGNEFGRFSWPESVTVGVQVDNTIRTRSISDLLKVWDAMNPHSSATAAVMRCAFDPFAASVAGGVVPPVDFSCRGLVAVATVDAPDLAFAVAPAVPDFVSGSSYPAAAGIAGLGLDFRCLEEMGAQQEEDPSGAGQLPGVNWRRG
jgi:hypothetical protein